MIVTFNTRTANGFSGVVFFPIRPVSGTVQTLTVSGAMASSGLVVRALTKIVAGAVGPSGVVVRRSTKSMAGVMNLSGIFRTPLVSRVVVGTLPMAGSVVTQRSQAISVTGTLGVAGALGRQATRWVVSTLPLAGTVIASPQIRSLAGVLGLSGTVIASPQIRSMAGVLGLSGTVENIRATLITIGGTLPMAGSLHWMLAMTVRGMLASVGAVQRGVSQVFSAVIDFAGNRTLEIDLGIRVDGTLMPTGTVEFEGAQTLSLGGSLATIGTLTVRPDLDLPGSLGIDGGLTLQPSVSSQGLMSLEGDVRLGMDVQLSGSVGLDGDLSFVGDRIVDVDGMIPMAGTSGLIRALPFSGSVELIKALAVTLRPSKIMRHVLVMSGDVTTDFFRSFAGILPMIGVEKQTIATRVSGLMASSGVVYQQVQMDLSASLDFAGDVAVLGVEILAVTGVLGFNGALLAPTIAHLVVGTLRPIGALVLTPAILIRFGTIKLINAMLRFAGVMSPKLTGHAKPTDATLGDHSTLDDSELR